MKSNFTKLMLMPIFVLTIGNSFAQTTIDIIASSDAALGYHDNYPTANTNYGFAAQNGAFCIDGSAGGVNSNRALIKFDLSSIPVGATITSAYLNLYGKGATGNASGNLGTDNSSLLQRVTSSWIENVVTWNTQPTTVTQNEVTLAHTNNLIQDYTNIDVTNLVEDMITYGNNGFMLRLVNENVNNILLFYSIDGGETTKFPKLTVTYSGCATDTANKDNPLGYHDNYPTASTNYGGATQNAAFCVDGASGGVNINRALIGFDLTYIPNGATITSAKLNLYGKGTTGNVSGNLGTNNSSLLQRVTGNWTENITTWNSQPTVTSQNQVTLAHSTLLIEDYLNIDVTNLVQDMIDNGNYGFMLKLVNETPNNGLFFCSKEHSNSSKHPTLDVCYELKSSSVQNVNVNSIDFEVFPNPVSTEMTIKTEGNNDNFDIQITTLDGKVILKLSNLNSFVRIPTNHFSDGLYLLTINSKGSYSTKKIIISN